MASYMNTQVGILSRSISLIILCTANAAAYAETFTEIPDVTATVTDQTAFKFYLELVVNTYATQKVVPVILKDDTYYLPRKELQDLKIEYQHFTSESELTDQEIQSLGLNPITSDWVKLHTHGSDYTVAYSSQHQQLMLNLPSQWLPKQMLGKDYWYERTRAKSGFGLLNNYDAYYVVPHEGAKTLNLYTEQRIFSPYGSFANSGIYRNIKGENDQNKSDEYIRYDTNFRFDHEDKVFTLELGDIYSSQKNSWTNSVRMGGIQLKRNFSIRPDLITYPLPQFSGDVALPSTVDLFINGTKNTTEQLQPGPFLISNVPFINGRGEAVIVTTDAVGRQISTTVPFYISGDLLKAGLFDYSVSAGKLRENFGIENFDYGDFVASFDGRYGLSSWLTAEGHIEGNEKIWNAGIGAVTQLGNWGVLNASYSHSAMDERPDHFKSDTGHQFTASYQYQQRHFGFNVLYNRRSESFSTLANYYSSGLLSVNSTENTSANVYVSSNQAGTFGLGYFNLKRNGEADDTELLSLSWAPVLPSFLNGASVSLSANQDLNDQAWSGVLQVSVPLGMSNHRVNAGYQYQENGFDSSYVNYNYQMPTDGGFGVDLTHRFNDSGDDYSQAQIRYRNRYFNASAGISGSDDYDQWYGFAGSLVWMKNSVFLSNRLGESFALVSTNKNPNIPIRYENNLIGETNKKGYLFVPNVTPYYGAKYSIDPLSLPSNYSTPLIEQRTSAKLGTGIVVDFPVQKVQSANVYLKLADGKAVPTGAVVHQEGKNSTYVGMDGMVYIESVDKENRLQVVVEGAMTCLANFKAELDLDEIQTIDDVICQ